MKTNNQLYKCNECKYKTKNKGNLKRHNAFKHDINVTWHKCDIEKCNAKFKTKEDLKRHKAFKHDIDVTWHKCDIEECKSKFKTNTKLKRHKAYKHNIDVTWYKCDIEECKAKFKTNAKLKRHKAFKHDIDVKWYKCDIEECEAKFKTNTKLKRHKAFKHDIDVKWYKCDIEECEAKFKTNTKLKIHKENVHDIGKYKCDFCLGNRNSHILFNDKQGKHFICRKCFKKATGYQSRAEEYISNYLDKHIGKEFLLGTDKSFKSMGGCSRYRPDKLYGSGNLIIQFECDEYEHKRHNENYACDEKRISDIYDEFSGKKHIIIRWNPDNYKIVHDTEAIMNNKKPNRKERSELLVKLFKKIQSLKHKHQIYIYYMFYSNNNPRIAKNIPYTFVYSENDIDNL